MVFLKLLFYHPYTIRIETCANMCATPKSLAHTIEISCLLPHGSGGDTSLRHFVTQRLPLYSDLTHYTRATHVIKTNTC